MSCGNFQLHAFTYGDSYLPAPTSETKKFLNGTYRVYDKLHLSCSEFFRTAIESTRKQLLTYAQKLFDEMRPELGKKCACCLAFYELQLSCSELFSAATESMTKTALNMCTKILEFSKHNEFLFSELYNFRSESQMNFVEGVEFIWD